LVEAHEQKSKYKVIIPVGRDGPRGSCGKKALNCQIFIIGNAVCGDKAPLCRTMPNGVRSFNGGMETVQVADHEWYHNTPEEWFCEFIWKLPNPLQ
jgi:hypothetical protein